MTHKLTDKLWSAGLIRSGKECGELADTELADTLITDFIKQHDEELKAEWAVDEYYKHETLDFIKYAEMKGYWSIENRKSQAEWLKMKRGIGTIGYISDANIDTAFGLEPEKPCSCFDGSGIICKEHFYKKDPETKDYDRALVTYIAENYVPKPVSTNKEFNPQGIDAVVWAKEFVRLHRHNIKYPLDEETMIGWFANAIMAGMDEKERRMEKSHIRKDEVELDEEKVLDMIYEFRVDYGGTHIPFENIKPLAKALCSRGKDVTKK
jgi:hypothetical protein